MASRDPQQRERGSFRLPPPLLPMAKRVHADSKRLREAFLRQAHKRPQCSDVLARFDLSTHDPSALACLDRTPEVGAFQLWDVTHEVSYVCAWNSSTSGTVAVRALMIRTVSEGRSVQTTKMMPRATGSIAMNRSSRAEEWVSSKTSR